MMVVEGRGLPENDAHSRATDRETVLREGHNCWRTAHASHVRFLVDVADYCNAFAEAAQRARESIMIVGWDFNGLVELWRDDREDVPVRVGDFLVHLADRTPGLHIRILDWDYPPFPYVFDREFLPRFRWDWRGHERIDFRLDAACPVGGSHHQKIVVIDDQIAFVGGIDFGVQRWDTREHVENDSRRVDPYGNTYRPFHDAQIAVAGPAAKCIGDLARQRWHCATGEELAPAKVTEAIWPDDWDADVRDVTVAVARTEPDFGGRPAVAEIRQFLVDSIRDASESIFFENQYLSASVIGDALCQRLAEENGPEVVIILRESCLGWLEEQVMGTLRAKLRQRLEAADHYGRLRIYYPRHGETCIDVHSKIFVFDRKVAAVGSANLSNRSMALDTECAVIIDGNQSEEAESAVRSFLDGLLAEHLGTEASAVGEAIETHGSIIKAIEALCGRPRTLAELPEDKLEWAAAAIPAGQLLDPESPAGLSNHPSVVAIANVSGMTWAALATAATALIGIYWMVTT